MLVVFEDNSKYDKFKGSMKGVGGKAVPVINLNEVPKHEYPLYRLDWAKDRIKNNP